MITDLSYLSGMSGGNPDIIKEMINIFIEQTQEYIVDMQKLLDEKLWVSTLWCFEERDGGSSFYLGEQQFRGFCSLGKC